MDSKLSASSDEAECAAVAGAGTLGYPEASSDYETPKDPDTPSSFVAEAEGVSVSVHSSSNWEAVTTPDATFFSVALAARAARMGWKCLGARTRGHTHHLSQ